jgi:hypothetical protein
MRELYRCPDGREVLLRYDEDALAVTTTTPDGRGIGWFKFELVGDDGQLISLTEDNGQAISLKLVETKLDDAWHGQGITEKVVQLVCDQTSLSPPGFEEL